MSEALPPWRQTFTVHSFDVDQGGLLAPRVFCAFLQEAAGQDAARRGAGMAELMARGLAWVLHRLVVVVDEWPAQDTVVAVTTWPTRFGGAAAERDFEVENAEGRAVARATSRWAVADLATRRAVRVPDFLRRLPLQERESLIALSLFEVRATDASLLDERRLGVRRSDLDRVGHANNTRYVEWGLEAVPEDWLKAHVLTGFDVVYRREALLGDAVVSRVYATSGGMRLSHELRLEAALEPLAEMVTRWRTR